MIFMPFESQYATSY